MIREPLGPDVLVLTSPRKNDMHGDPLPGPLVTRTVEGCMVFPNTSSEDTNRASTIITGLTALLPIDPDEVTSDMRVTYHGKDYAINGDPGRWTFMDGDPACAQIALKTGSDGPARD